MTVEIKLYNLGEQYVETTVTNSVAHYGDCCAVETKRYK